MAKAGKSAPTGRKSSKDQGSTEGDQDDGVGQSPSWFHHPFAVGLFWVLGALAAVATVVAVVMQLWPKASESQPDTGSGLAHRVVSVHVNNPVAGLDEVMGSPVRVEDLDGEVGWTQRTYVASDVAVSAVIDDSGDIRLFSVMVCAPDTWLRIATPSGTTVTLQGPPISQAEASDRGDAVNDRRLSYLDGFTGSSLGHLIEESQDRPRGGNGWRSYLIGINRACGPTDFMSSGEPGGISYFGDVSDAPSDLQAFRGSTPANFYTEIAGDYRITDQTLVDFFGLNANVTGALAAPYVHDLPSDFLDQAR